jgi:hypothetical protein
LFGLRLSAELILTSVEDIEFNSIFTQVLRNIQRSQNIIHNLSKLYSGEQNDFNIDVIPIIKESITLAKSELKGLYVDISLINFEEIILVDASGKIINQVGITNSISDQQEKTMSLSDFQSFVLNYKNSTELAVATTPIVSSNLDSSVDNLKPVTVNKDLAPSNTPRFPLTASVASTFIGPTSTRDEETFSDLEERESELVSRGFWGKLFHPVETIKNAFYK